MDIQVAVWQFAEAQDIVELKYPIRCARRIASYADIHESWLIAGVGIPPLGALEAAWDAWLTERNADRPVKADIGQRREAIQRAFSARGVGFIRAVANLAQTMMQGWVILERADSIGVNHLDGFYDAAKADIDSDANLTDAFTARHEIFFGEIQADPTAREKQDYLLTAQMMVNEFAALAALTDALDLALS